MNLLDELLAMQNCLDPSKTVDQIKAGVIDHLLCTARAQERANVAIGSWLSAAVEDPQACQEFKYAAIEWFRVVQPKPLRQ